MNKILLLLHIPLKLAGYMLNPQKIKIEALNVHNSQCEHLFVLMCLQLPEILQHLQARQCAIAIEFSIFYLSFLQNWENSSCTE